jgi:hypothetical protein
VTDEDPGWKIHWSMLPVGVMPHLYFLRRDRGEDGLVLLRTLFVSFSLALVLIGALRLAIGTIDGAHPKPAVSLPIAVVFGIGALVAQRLVPAGLDCSSAAALSSTYRNRFLVRLAVAESAALVAFATSLVIGPWWVYFVGASFSVYGFARIAPTRARLIADQDELVIDGCPRSLVAALRGTGRT